MPKTTIGIICAMDDEAKLIISDYQLKPIADDYFKVFASEDKNIVLLVSKIGKIYATMGTQWLISHYQVAIIINIGLAGGIKADYQIGEVFLGHQVWQHDIYLPWDETHLHYFTQAINLPIIDHNLKTAIILTGDQFINDPDKCKILANKGDIVEMEAFAVASVASSFKVPVCIIKAISDNALTEASTDFKHNIKLAMTNSLPVLRQVIGKIPQFLLS